MFKVLLIAAVVMLAIYYAIELAQTKGTRVRTMPHWLRLFVVICVPVIGPFTWLLAGRPSSRPRLRQLSPDSGGDFLRGLH